MWDESVGRLASTAGLLGVVSLLAIGCRSYPPIRLAESVDLDRFMGDWYVIAHIPASIEREAYNAVETYELRDDGSIQTTFRFNEGAFDGPEKVHTPRGFVRDHPSNAIWGMRFIWPFKMDYRIVYVDDAYERTIIGRLKRDYVWIMARTPTIPEEQLDALLAMIEAEGYDLTKVRRVPQEPRSEVP